MVGRKRRRRGSAGTGGKFPEGGQLWAPSQGEGRRGGGEPRGWDGGAGEGRGPPLPLTCGAQAEPQPRRRAAQAFPTGRPGGRGRGRACELRGAFYPPPPGQVPAAPAAPIAAAAAPLPARLPGPRPSHPPLRLPAAAGSPGSPELSPPRVQSANSLFRLTARLPAPPEIGGPGRRRPAAAVQPAGRGRRGRGPPPGGGGGASGARGGERGSAAGFKRRRQRGAGGSVPGLHQLVRVSGAKDSPLPSDSQSSYERVPGAMQRAPYARIR